MSKLGMPKPGYENIRPLTKSERRLLQSYNAGHITHVGRGDLNYPHLYSRENQGYRQWGGHPVASILYRWWQS